MVIKDESDPIFTIYVDNSGSDEYSSNVQLLSRASILDSLARRKETHPCHQDVH